MKGLLALAALAFSLAAQAQGYPTRPVRVVVPFPSGSATDQVARIIGQQLQEALGHPFVIEDKAGAQGGIAAAEVAKSAPDGYTLMVTTNTPQAANVSLFKKLAYDPVNDFTAITRFGTTSFMLMVRADFPAKTLKEFIAQARTQPGKLSAGYGSSGSQVSIAMLKSLGKLDIVEVPYKGIPQTVTDTLGGSLQLTFVDLANAMGQVKGGKLRGLAITSGKRSPIVPDLPAVAEELPGYEVIAWFGLVAPAKLPEAIVKQLDGALHKSMATADFKQKFAGIGADVAPMGPAEFGKFIQSEVVHWAKLVKMAGIEPE